ncbi:nucleotidyltransferase domain-containing protein [Actinopolymorpha alba]|uniref:nucleotidyltransferase domain-containing protein n=1 Tax=Actinopolymorpha alba TaxID=533267 RepID=UPI0012F6EDA0|nr:nucleotidyltransferase domain-containing protein [Actinopolymorpha alba]
MISPKSEEVLGAGTRAGTWHAEALPRVSAVAATDGSVEELWIFGSGATDDLDEWSDLDLGVVVPTAEVGRVASPAWLGALGPVWTFQTFTRECGAGVRVIYRDGRWIDLIAVDDREAIPHERRRLSETRISPELSGPPNPVIPEIPPLIKEFRFTAALAVTKAARNDLLIGGHLALELPRQCLVAGMMLRDREAGSTHHRFGGPLNDVLSLAFDLVPDSDAGREGVLDLVDASAGLFDELASGIWPDYVSDWSGLTVLLDRARAI